MRQVNVDGTKALVKAAAEAGVKRLINVTDRRYGHQPYSSN